MIINTKKPIYFYDDRSKDNSKFKLDEILFENEEVCLCKMINTDFILEEKPIILLDKKEKRVLTSNYEFWYATNKTPYWDKKNIPVNTMSKGNIN